MTDYFVCGICGCSSDNLIKYNCKHCNTNICKNCKPTMDNYTNIHNKCIKCDDQNNLTIPFKDIAYGVRFTYLDAEDNHEWIKIGNFLIASWNNCLLATNKQIIKSFTEDSEIGTNAPVLLTNNYIN